MLTLRRTRQQDFGVFEDGEHIGRIPYAVILAFTPSTIVDARRFIASIAKARCPVGAGPPSVLASGWLSAHIAVGAGTDIALT
jgi:hypothetical protein